MFGRLLGSARSLSRNLSRLDHQPIGRAALVIVILLDIFILGSLFDGLDEHTRQLTSPLEYVPSRCQHMVLERRWDTTSRFVQLAEAASRYRSRSIELDNQPDFRQMQPVCARLEEHLQAVFDDQPLVDLLDQFQQLRRETSATQVELRRLKGAYDTSLLERMADTAAERQAMTGVGAEVRSLSDRMGALTVNQAQLQASAEVYPQVRSLFDAIDAVTDTERDRLHAEYRQRTFWFPVRRLGMELLFLAPVLLVFYAWNARSLVRARPYQVLVSSHLLVVTCIPVLFRIIQLVYDIIPRKLLRQVIELLESLQLVALWYYLLIGLAILAALATIYLFQKKLFSHDRLVGRRIARGQCQQCGVHLADGTAVCPLCGYHQFRKCAACGQDSFVQGRYCRVCGAEQSLHDSTRESRGQG